MSTDHHFYEPTKGHGLKHNPFKAIVAPRPIGWISTRSAAGGMNLAPYSFFNALCSAPPILAFSCEGQKKDTLRNVEHTGEFVFNVVTRRLAERMNTTAASVGPEVDEFQLAGLTPASCRLVSAPRVAESPVAMECKCTDIQQLKSADGQAVAAWLVLGEVVGVHIDRAFLRDGVYDTGLAGHLARGGGMGDYFWIGEENQLQMTRPA